MDVVKRLPQSLLKFERSVLAKMLANRQRLTTPDIIGHSTINLDAERNALHIRIV